MSTTSDSVDLDNQGTYQHNKHQEQRLEGNNVMPIFLNSPNMDSATHGQCNAMLVVSAFKLAVDLCSYLYI